MWGLGDEKGAQLERFVAELQSWGERMNLVGSTERNAIEVHVRDALAAAEHLPKDARVADLGSGAGFPGVPLAIARPDVTMVLVEARERRVHFLRHVVRSLGLDCAVWRQRIESGPRTGRFDCVVARAVAEPAEVLRLGLPWLDETGEVWLWTRESAQACGVHEARSIPIEGQDLTRGHILRVPARAIPRGT